MDPSIVNGFLKEGTLGVIIIALIFAVIKLYTRMNEIQEKRIAESRESVKTVEQNTAAMESFASLLKDRRNNT